MLEAAWERVRANQGAPGVDGITIQQITMSDQGVVGLLEGLQESLRAKTYRPQAAYCEIERYVRDRLIQHLRRRSQRPYRPPPGEPWLQHLAKFWA